MAWRIYYDDGSTFTGKPEDAPRVGVVAIAQHNGQHGPLVIHGFDYYWHQPVDDPAGEWQGGEIFGLWDYMTRVEGRPLVLFGRWMPTDAFQAIFERAKRDTLK